MLSNREWMYTKRLDSRRLFNPQWPHYVNLLLDFAYTNATNIQRIIRKGVEVFEIRCPCVKCKNIYYHPRESVFNHLIARGFMNGYSLWYLHGKKYPTLEIGQCSNPETGQHIDNDFGDYHRYEEMVIERMHQLEASYYQQTPHNPNLDAQNFYKILKQASEPLWDGCTKTSTLATTTRLLDWKSQSNVLDTSFDKLLSIVKDILSSGEKLPNSFYETKKMLKPLKLPSEWIHVCINHCMLFRGQFADLDQCVVCGENRYKDRGRKVPHLVLTYMPIGPRLQRLFYSRKTAKHLTWHADHSIDPEKMTHPSEGKAWNHFDTTYPDFANETRNIRLGLCTDGLSPNNSNTTP